MQRELITGKNGMSANARATKGEGVPSVGTCECKRAIDRCVKL